MSRMLIFGLGYTATRIADALRRRGWRGARAISHSAMTVP